MAVATLFPAPVAKPHTAEPKHGRGLLWLAHHGAAIDASASPVPLQWRRQKPRYLEPTPKTRKLQQQKQKQPPLKASGPVYMRCMMEALHLKARIHRAHPEPISRFKLSIMRRVFTPPVRIPAALRDKPGCRGMVGNHEVPITRAMWEAEKATLALGQLGVLVEERRR